MEISPNLLNTYRAKKYQLNPDQRIKSIQDAEQFVNERGFIHFWPIKGVELPSLWAATVGSRPVADAHDDPGHVTWGWKDESLGKKIWYYGKVLRKKATMISLDVAPNFYALSRNYGNPEEDIQIDFLDGRITSEAKLIFNVILNNGPIDTIAIRRTARMTSKETDYAFDRSIAFLQSDFKVLPVGISDSGGWRYAFIYDLVHRHYTDLPIAAQIISERTARRKILDFYFASVGAAQLRDLTKLFRWSKEDTQIALEDLISIGRIFGQVRCSQIPGEWFAIEGVLQEPT